MSARVLCVSRMDEALRALLGATERSRLLAGGTDLMVELSTARTQPDLVIDIWRLDELRGIRVDSGGLRVGALECCTALARSPLVLAQADLLAQAAAEVGAVQIQNRATLGGNLGTASPAADLTPVLMALDARVRLVSLGGTRELSIDEFLVGYRQTARRTDELIESILIPLRSPTERRGFRKVGTRRAQSIAKLVVAVALDLQQGSVVAVRAAAGSVAERTLRLVACERALTGRAPSEKAIEQAARDAAVHDARPIDDVRSTASYRRQALRRVLVTLLGELTRTPGGS